MPTSAGWLSRGRLGCHGDVGQQYAAQHWARWERRDNHFPNAQLDTPSLGLLPDCWEQPAPSSAIPYHLPAVRTGGCTHTPPACPSLEQPTSCSFCSPHSSPSQYASSPLDVLPFPCLLRSRRAQSWPGEALPLPRRGDALSPLHPALHRDIFPYCLSTEP